MKDAYKRRRAKARVEKSARIKKLPTITLEFAKHVVEDETGIPLVLPVEGNEEEVVEVGELKLRARDNKRNPLVSAYVWSDDAVKRLFQVPVGFMRERMQQRAELITKQQKLDQVEMPAMEEALEESRVAMEQFIAEQGALSGTPAVAPSTPEPQVAKQEAAAEAPAAPDQSAEGEAKASAGKCPFHNMAMDIVSKPDLTSAAKEGLYLNEVGLMSTLDSKRKQ